MNNFLLIFSVFTVLCLKIAVCDDGFVAIWAPIRITDGKPLRPTIFTSNIHDEVKVGIQYRSTNSKFDLKNEEFKTIDINNREHMAKLGSIMNITLHRSVSSVHQCSTTTFKILPEQRDFHIFIQTDKPIYKPGDDLRFRILVIDNDLKPFHMNNIKVEIIDPINRVIQTFNDLAGQFSGLFEKMFKINSNAILGDWTINVLVNNKEQYETSKNFAVQKYILPLFEVHVSTNEQHYLLDHDVNFVFYAKYSFGGFVTGNAELVVKNLQSGQEYYKKLFRNVDVVDTFSANLRTELEVDTKDSIALEAIVTFTEPESGLSFYESTTFYAHSNTQYTIKTFHPSKFTTNSKFTVTVHVLEWNGEKAKIRNENVELKFSFTATDFNDLNDPVQVPIVNGVASYDIEVPKMAEMMLLEVKFTNSKTHVESEVYKAKIEPGLIDGGIASLDVDHEPKSPKLNDKVQISIKSDSKLNKILSIVTNKLGNIQSQVIECNNNVNCEYFVTINEEMMPSSTVTVYHVKDKGHIYTGSTSIGTESFRADDFQLELSKTEAETKEKIKMYFDASEKSKIYLLAIDKNLKFLRDGNDITENDISSAFGIHDGRNQLKISDFSSWSICTQEELDRVGIRKMYAMSNKFRSSILSYSPAISDSSMEESDENDKKPEEPPVLRKYFPETWIFESFETGSQKTTIKEFKVPDSITTWHISAFSLNNDKGLGIAQPQELKVLNQFFIKMDLPYSIRFMEVLQIDILVFNNVETKDFIKADVILENLNGNEFEFVEFPKTCTFSYSNKNSSSTTTTPFPYKSAKKVSFYIRSNPTDNDFGGKVEKRIKLRIRAIGYGYYGRTYQDEMEKELLVEPAGISVFNKRIKDYKLNGESTNPYIQQTDYPNELRGVNVVVVGDFMSDSLVIDQEFDFTISDSPTQQVNKFKANIDHFRYRLAKERYPPISMFNFYFQKILEQTLDSWNTDRSLAQWTSVISRINFLDGVASAIEIGLINKQARVEQALDAIKNNQQNSGEFGEFGFKSDYVSQYEAAADNYHKTAVVLITFLKFRELLEKRYEDVIEKAFNYLKLNENSWNSNYKGYAVAAYAYTLNNDAQNANQLLSKVETISVYKAEDKKCFKIKQNDYACDVMHTAYAALAYVQLGEISKAFPLTRWLISVKNINYFQSTLHDHALGTETVANFLKYLKIEDTKLTVTIKNDGNFEKSLEVNSENTKNFQNIELPKNTQDAITKVEGHGYCSVTTIFERTVSVPKASSNFKMTINATEKNDIEKVVKISAENIGISTVIEAVYEVEMPSGYVFDGIGAVYSEFGPVDDVKSIDEKRNGTLIFITFSDFKTEESYSVDVKARKVFDVMGAKLAGVKVYDLYNKQNLAVEFYKFSNEMC